MERLAGPARLGLQAGMTWSVVFSEADVQARVRELASTLAAEMDDSWTLAALLQGAMPFAVDLLRELARLDRHPSLDCLWLESYRDARESSGRVVVRADISRSVEGRAVLLVDEVFDTGRTLAYARAHLMAKGARLVRTCALVRKPGALGEPIDHVGFDAGERFLVGYGMDDAGRYRGLPFIAALD